MGENLAVLGEKLGHLPISNRRKSWTRTQSDRNGDRLLGHSTAVADLPIEPRRPL